MAHPKLADSDRIYLDGIRRTIAQSGRPGAVLENLPPLLREYQQPEPSEALLAKVLTPSRLLTNAINNKIKVYIEMLWSTDLPTQQRRIVQLNRMMLLARQAAIMSADSQGFDNWRADFSFECDDLRKPLQAALLYATQSVVQTGVLECARLQSWSGEETFRTITSMRPDPYAQSNRIKLRPI